MHSEPRRCKPRVDPEERTDAVSMRTGSLRSSAAPRRAWPLDFTRTTKPSSRAREPRRKKTGCANGSPPNRVRLSTWRSRERTADSTWARPEPLRGVAPADGGLGADSRPPGLPHAKPSGHGNPGGTTYLHTAPTNRATRCDGASGGNGRPPALLRPGEDRPPPRPPT
jgi:hypothetical protein